MQKHTNGHSDTAIEPGAPVADVSDFKTTLQPGMPAMAMREELLLSPQELDEATELDTLYEDSGISTGAIAPIPIPIAKNKVYGTYKGVNGTFELELRVDTDGPTPLQKVSGDYYTVSGATKTYFGSFVANGVAVVIAAGVVTITGTVQSTWSTPYTKIKLSINQTNLLQPLAPAKLQWIHGTTGAPGALYVCNYAKRGYRTVRLEQDFTAGVVPFTNYNTGSLPSGGAARVLSINTAYAEAGVDMLSAGVANVVPIALAGADAKWTDAELHNAMVNHFSLYQNNPVWDVWLLHAYEHIIGPGLYGIMFDQQGLQRQGAAVFYRGIGGNTAEQKRLQLYTCVHELGHCFNLLHSWQKSLATPPKPNIPASLSWMNYPWSFPGGGAPVYWGAFPFRFDNVELAHIRHGFRNNVIMGGNAFTVGSSLEDISALFEKPVENNANLDIVLESRRSYFLGEPVDLEIKLKTTTFKNNQVVSNLHPDFGFVTIGIKKPGGNVVVYEPLAEKCIIPEHSILNVANPSIYENAYIGFDKNGFIFDQPGKYEIVALYYAEDGSRIVSDPLSLRVKNPVTADEDELADLYMADQVGFLMKFKGSDASYLQKGNDALDLVIDKFKDHPLAVYAEYVKGVNAQRTFKTITPGKDLIVRKPDFAEGEKLLTQVIEKSKAGDGLDDIRLNKTMRTLATAYLREGNMEEAQATMNNMVAYFNEQPIKQHVKDLVAVQAEKTLQEKP
ncbi:MAG: hypothetical protein JWR72_2507 [Flavisolibacter sp.]|jgi:hypothetical protein|nr:hypothetical protein [Flavisolibacter sp.]